MKYRLLAATACTAFSSRAIAASLSMKAPLWIAAWVAYLLILCFWVQSDRAPKALLVVGTSLGVVSAISSPFLIALLWALPSVGLMLHVIRCSLRNGAPGFAIKRDVLRAVRPSP